MSDNVVFFAHGQESGPWGTKITALAEVAKHKGFEVESPDYSFIRDADQRTDYLLRLNPSADKHLVLVGSSMGGYVATMASQKLNVSGLFLMAPAFFIPGYRYQDPPPRAGLVTIIHGWHDDVIPLDHSLRYAQEYNVDLHILDGDHRLTNVLSSIETLFGFFLDRVLTAKESHAA